MQTYLLLLLGAFVALLPPTTGIRVVREAPRPVPVKLVAAAPPSARHEPGSQPSPRTSQLSSASDEAEAGGSGAARLDVAGARAAAVAAARPEGDANLRRAHDQR